MTAPRWLALTSLAALASLAPAAEGRTAASPAEEPAAAAVGSGDPAAAAGDPAADMQTAIKLYEQARDRQRRGDYVGEIALLKHALAISPDAPEYAKYRGTLLYALASACHQLHDQTGDAAALSEALRWLAAYELQLADDDRASRSDIQRQRAIIEAKLQAAAAAEEVEERAAEEARAGASTVAPAPTPAAPVAAAPPTRDRVPFGPTASRLFIAGGFVTGYGVAALIIMTSGMAIGAQRDRDIQALMTQPDHDHARVDELQEEGLRANTAAWVGGVAGGVLLVTGVSLLGAGAYERRRELASGANERRRELAIAPTFGRAGAGVRLRWRF